MAEDKKPGVSVEEQKQEPPGPPAPGRAGPPAFPTRGTPAFALPAFSRV